MGAGAGKAWMVYDEPFVGDQNKPNKVGMWVLFLEYIITFTIDKQRGYNFLETGQLIFFRSIFF